ncbi:peptidoglycan-binding domain-containing protein [Leekyejoonella antrihumi]|nr:peptidoglycan-binding domain-containing protein [Leekyejoonella antrihumi]
MKMIAKRAAVCAAALATMGGGAVAVAPGAHAATTSQAAVTSATIKPAWGNGVCYFTSTYPRVGYHYVTYGSAVKQVQCRLLAYGYSIGYTGVDGIFGKNTYTAVVRFQRAVGLYADGIVGPNTWRYLGY